jgi:hypothetical protein
MKRKSIADPGQEAERGFAGKVWARPALPRRVAAACVIAAVGVAVFGAGRAGAAPPLAKEYKIKATYLFNFAQYVEWPPAAFTNAEAPIVIGVLGDAPFCPFLEDLVREATVGDRPLRVKRNLTPDELKACHLLFISKSETASLAPTLAALGEASILTVGETPGFALQGGIFNLVLEGDRIRFEVNLAAAQRRGLKMSSQVLRLGTIVGAKAK